LRPWNGTACPNQFANRLLKPCTLHIDTAIHRPQNAKRSESLRTTTFGWLGSLQIVIHSRSRQMSELHMLFGSAIGLRTYCSWILGLSCLYVGPIILRHFEPYSRPTTSSGMCCSQNGHIHERAVERVRTVEGQVVGLLQPRRLLAGGARTPNPYEDSLCQATNSP